MIFAITGLSFLTAMCLVVGIYLMLTANKREVVNRMNKFTRTPGQMIIDDQNQTREKNKFKNTLRIVGRVFEKRSYTKKVQDELLKADIPMRGEEFIVFNLLLIVMGVSVGFLLGGIGPMLVAGLVTLMGPGLFIKRQKKLRFEKLNTAIGDCITVMSNSLRAGYSFQQAMEMVGREMNGPLAMEFTKTLREISFGTPSEQALANMANRVESDDLDLMITAVLIQRQIGGNLAEILDNISSTLRERIRIKGEIKTLTAQGRVSGLIIGLMPPILLAILLIINPEYIGELLQNEIGIMFLIGGAISEIFGVIVIRKIVNIEV